MEGAIAEFTQGFLLTCSGLPGQEKSQGRFYFSSSRKNQGNSFLVGEF